MIKVYIDSIRRSIKSNRHVVLLKEEKGDRFYLFGLIKFKAMLFYKLWKGIQGNLVCKCKTS
jgi:hypothetical protein